MKLTLFCTILLFTLVPSLAFSQDTMNPVDTTHHKFMVRHYSALHSIGTGLCIGGAAIIAGGAMVILPTLGKNEANSVPNRNLGLYIVAGGLAVTMVGVIMLSQSGTKLKYHRKQLEGLSLGLNPDPAFPGLSMTFRF